MQKIIKLCLTGVLLVVIGMATTANAQRQILFIDSYHKGNQLSDGVTQGIRSTLKGQNVTLKIHRMDTKRNKSEAFKKRAAIKARAVIDELKPDVIIASEDNASKYLIMPYFKNSSVPFVFCGVNFSAQAYGFPYSNVTGIVDVPPIQKLIYSLKHFCRVTSIGYLAADTLTQRKDGEFIKQDIREKFIPSYVNNLQAWKNEFVRLQEEVDILILGNNSGIKGWNSADVKRFTMENIKIPTGCILDSMTPFAFLGATRNPQEQGAYAAATALKILDGAPVSSIPVVKNKEIFIIINLKFADRLNLKIPKSFMRLAKHVIK